MNKLTVVIPFCNEGAYLNKTLNSIRMTAEEEVDIIIVNDASDGGIDYKEMAEEYQCKYILNETSIGPSACREKAMELVETPYVLLIDGHMSFYFNDWHLQFIEALESNSRVIYCANPIPLDRYVRRDPQIVDNLLLDSNVSGVVASKSRRSFSLKDSSDSNCIPFLFGGSYAISKEYYNKLNGSVGLNGVGQFNLLMSLKVFLEGGEIRFLEDVHIGHIYTDLLSYVPNKEACRQDKAMITKLFLDLAEVEESKGEDELSESISSQTIEVVDAMKEFICDNLNERSFGDFVEYSNSFNEASMDVFESSLSLQGEKVRI